ncbi:MAG: hypothetical protein ACKO34_09010 [Vampirovibrionales bacterium]
MLPILPAKAFKRDWLMNLTAEQLLTMDEATFEATFTNTPLRRTGLKRLQRNVRRAKSFL